MGENASCICVDDLALLNKEIHEQINDLYLYHGEVIHRHTMIVVHCKWYVTDFSMVRRIDFV